MVIAVDTRGSNTYQKFISNVFTLITSQLTEHTFVFIADKASHYPIIANVIIENIKKGSSFLSTIGLQSKTSLVLKKYNASVLVSAKYSGSKVPTCFFPSYENSKKHLLRSKIIVAASEFEKKEIADKYKLDESRIDVVYRPVNNAYQSIDFDEREKIKDKFAGGNEFFIARIPVEVGKFQSGELLSLLKAFSRFKKMQKSNMRLLIVSSEIIDEHFKASLQLYKFINEVTMLEKGEEAELTTIMASAYAAVYPFNSNNYSVLLQFMQSGVPIISITTPLIKEICRDAAVYCDPTDMSIADKMMLVYKDEALRNELIENGSSRIKNFISEVSAASIWNSILKATS